MLVDGDLEGGSPSTAWTEASSNFGTPLCDTSSCGDYAYSGSWYVWFGGCGSSCTYPEVGSLSQQVFLPAGQTITLFFFLFAYPGANATANDVFSVQIDSTTVFTTDVLNTAYQSGYTPVTVDLTSLADGVQHTLTLYSSIASANTTFLMDLASLRIGENCCVDTCPQDGLSICSGEKIYTCQVNNYGCLEWSFTQDCSASGQVCLYNNNNQPYCQTPSPASVGVDCSQADAATPLTLPAEFMSPVVGQTNCGLGDTYSNTCLDNYDGGEDATLRVVVTEPVIARFVLDPKDSDWTGMALDSVCPLDSGTNDCLLKATNSQASPYSTGCAQLAAGTYYMMFDTYPTPDCIPEFDLIAVPCDCVTGQTRCADANTLQTCSASGVWTDRVCLAGCDDSSGTAQCLPAGDTCAQAVTLDVSSGGATVQVDNISNTNSFSAYSCASGRTGADIWLSFTLTEPAQVTITTSAPGTITDTVLALFDACEGTELACNDDYSSSNYYSSIQATLQPGTYYIVSEPFSTTLLGTWTVTVTAVYRQPVVQWTFEGDTTNPAVGTGTAAAGSGLTNIGFVTGNGGGSAWTAANWELTGTPNSNKYFEFSTSLAGKSSAAFSFDERRSDTGIHDFILHYSTDGVNFQELTGSTTSVPDDINWRSHSYELPQALDNQASVYIRIFGYNAEGNTGTWRVDNVTFSAF